MEHERMHCIGRNRSSSLEEATVRVSCFGLKKKAKPISKTSDSVPPTPRGAACSPAWREDSTSAVTQSEQQGTAGFTRQDSQEDASPRHWGLETVPLPLDSFGRLAEPVSQIAHPQNPLSDDEGTQTESVSDGTAPLAMHDSTSSLKEGVFIKGKRDSTVPCSTVQSDRLDERVDEEDDEGSYLKPEWEINPHDIFFCSRSNGKLCRLGKGAFGTVYKGVWMEETVAVKVCRQQHITTKAMKQFQKEVAILYGCHHDCIVQFKGACCWKGGKRTVLVTEYMEKGDLCTALGRMPMKFSWNKLGKSIALDVARGLAFLHTDNIVHFDLKSANILLDRDNRAKLADVGLAKNLTNYHGSDHLSTFMATGDLGTFAWAAPEVLLGFPCDSKADIFSFGVVMWELATTEMPQGRCLRPIRVPEEASEEVASLIMDCLRHDPAARPTAQQLVTVLSNLV